MLRYLAGTRQFGILYQGGTKCLLKGFSNNDWGTNPIDGKSTTGVVFTIRSGVVTWL